jgi:hypothetical protein
MGEGVELITSENGIRQSLALRPSRDGNPTKVGFLEKRVSPNGELRISQIKPSRENLSQVEEWSFDLEIPSGGFIENTEEFPFIAPQGDYQPRMGWHFKKGETNWSTHVSKQFYIVFDQPRKYGWLRIESDLAQETIFLTYAINPSGSRNLEPREQ